MGMGMLLRTLGAIVALAGAGCAVGVGGGDDAGGGADAVGDHVTRLDAVVVADGGTEPDVGSYDSGVHDTGALDTGAPDSGLPPLSCDPKFTAPKITSTAPFDVGFTDNVGWVYIGLDVTGPGSPSAQLTNINGSFTWHFRVTGHAAGKLHLTFTKDNGTKVASCELWVL